MLNIYSWIINALDTYPTQDSLVDVVYNIHWEIKATSNQKDSDDNPYTAICIGTQVIAAPNANDFTAFDSLKQDIIEAWLEASELDIDNIKVKLDAEIAEKITPTSVTKKIPW